MKMEEIIAVIERSAPLWGAADWDLSGPQVASSRKDASRLALFLDPTPASITAALREGADFMLSHHPLTLKPELPNKLNAWHESLRLLLNANVGLYAAHTSLDVNMAGPAGWFGREMELKNTEILEPCHEPTPLYPYGLGFGEIGDLAAPMPLNGLASHIVEMLNLDAATLCGPKFTEPLRRIAYCPGSGSSLAALAKARGARLLVTGDVKYHVALDADIAILDVGHHSLEEEMMRHFATKLAGELPDIDVFFIPSKPPFRMILRKN